MDLRWHSELMRVFEKDENKEFYYFCNHMFWFKSRTPLIHLHSYMKNCVELQKVRDRERYGSISSSTIRNANGDEKD